jgi:hypothetical protein
MSLTADEVARGWVEFVCDAHGFRVATTPNATVWCSCGKRARHQRHGRLVDPDTLKPTAAKARKLNSSGQPFIHACGDCGEDFQGVTLQKRHRIGRPGSKRCLTQAKMFEKGWGLDEDGRWRDRSDTERLSRLKGHHQPYNARPCNAPREPVESAPKGRSKGEGVTA